MNNNGHTLKEQIYNDIFTDIVHGKYPVNTIITEKFLMEKYNVSRAPIREALMQLTGTAVLSSIPRQGYKITAPSIQQMRDITSFRNALETSFLKTFYSFISADTIAELHKLCQAYDACATNDFIGRWHFNCLFHLKLFASYNNDYCYKLLQEALSIQTIFFVQSKHYASTSLHLAILDYLEKDEIDTAINILKADIGHFLLSTSAEEVS